MENNTVSEETALPESGGHQRILLVDDEIQITTMAKRLLERSGYLVEEETDSVIALEKFKTDPARFDIVITDMRMPKMSGAKLSKELLRIRPDIPIILCTGFSEDMDRSTAESIGISAFIMKPISRQTLTETIRNLLDRKPAE